jgi:hypothetical protein
MLYNVSMYRLREGKIRAEQGEGMRTAMLTGEVFKEH